MDCLLCKIFGHSNSYFERTTDKEKISGLVCRRCYAETNQT